MLYPFLSLKEHVMDRRLVSLVSMTVLLGVCSLVGAVDIPAIPAPITVNDPHVDPLDAQAPSFDFADDLVIQQMLSTWNTPDHHGMSYVECHGSPNAAEFFLVGIDQGDVVRRGLPHHPQDKVDDPGEVTITWQAYERTTAQHFARLSQPDPDRQADVVRVDIYQGGTHLGGADAIDGSITVPFGPGIHLLVAVATLSNCDRSSSWPIGFGVRGDWYAELTGGYG